MTLRLSVPHYEHEADGWLEYSDSVYGEMASRFGGFMEQFLAFDNVEIIVCLGLAVLIVASVSISTIGKARSGLIPIYVGLGLIFAAAIRNEGEIAWFGHATDILFIRPIGVANLADGMVLVGFILVLLTSTYKKVISDSTRAIDNPPPIGS